MTISPRFRVLSRRGVRVLTLTVVIASVACECDTTEPLSQCFLQVTNRACVFPSGSYSAGDYQTVSYIPAGSSCVSCSSCRDVVTTTISVDGACIEGCRAACGD